MDLSFSYVPIADGKATTFTPHITIGSNRSMVELVHSVRLRDQCIVLCQLHGIAFDICYVNTGIIRAFFTMLSNSCGLPRGIAGDVEEGLAFASAPAEPEDDEDLVLTENARNTLGPACQRTYAV